MNDLSEACDLPTYALAELLESIPESNTELARRLGKSRTYVSRMRKTWRGACPSLRRAWAADEIPYNVVKRIADIGDGPEQARALAAYQRLAGGKSRYARGRALAALKNRKQLLQTEASEIDAQERP